MARPVGLITAMVEEIHHFAEHFRGEETVSELGWEFVKGELDGVPLVAVEAGIGKVQTAVVSTLLAQHFDCGALIFSGVAGGLSMGLAIGDAVIAERSIQIDYGALTDDGLIRYQPGVPPLPQFPRDHGYLLDPTLRDDIKKRLLGFEMPEVSLGNNLPIRRPSIRLGTILTGDLFINSATERDRLFEETGAFAFEMEGAAMAQVADRVGIPWLVLRTLSDLAGSDSHLDFSAFVSATAGGAAALVRHLLPAVADRANAG
ncbi:MAG: 5'-methylthioadenosine/adenosylhomocysteine nucleosidase [Pseudomonadota bacterium]